MLVTTAVDQFSSIRAIGELSNEGVLIFHLPKRKVIYLNDKGREITGLNLNSFPVDMEDLLQIVAPGDQEYVVSEYTRFMNTHGPADVEFRLRKGEGIVTVCCTGHLIFDKSVVVLFIKDISKARQYEDYLVEFGTKKNTLLDTLMHQLSGALVLMQHLSAEAQKSIDAADIKNQKIYFQLLNDNARHGVQIIEDLLKDEHSKAPFVSIKTARVDVVAKTALIYQNLKNSYRDRVFTMNSSNPAIYIRVDEFKLLQVVNNFISNALKFTSDSKEIAFNIKEESNEIIISIADEGIGIPEQLKPYIFEGQGVSGRDGLKGEKSKGLGLFISKKLVEVMQGRIWFESEEGKGSTFYFAVPKN
ncbi:MAG TPA: ATP-binding protein [Chryseolinea sp.]|nr:ATP-binding protein [Chryseolinea sp.]